jgi:hypothetical protein
MPADPNLDRWLEAWEACRLREPLLTVEDFLAGLDTKITPDLLAGIRRTIADLDWVTEVMGQIKKRDRQRGRPSSEDHDG